MDRALTEKFVKYIAEMANRLERKSLIDSDEVDAINRELENFKRNLREENGPHSRQFLDLSPIALRLDPRYVEGSGRNGIASLLGALKAFGPLGLFQRHDQMGDNRQRIQDFKSDLRRFVYNFDDYAW